MVHGPCTAGRGVKVRVKVREPQSSLGLMSDQERALLFQLLNYLFSEERHCQNKW